jgi:hypothetical protein
MPEILKTATTAGLVITLQQLEAVGIKPGHRVTVSRWYPVTSNKQKGLFFCFLQYCIDNGLKEHGHFSVDGLYQDIKAWARDSHPADFKTGVRLSRMNQERFELFLNLVDAELMIMFFGIDTSRFWQEYNTWKASGTEQDFAEWKRGEAA